MASRSDPPNEDTPDREYSAFKTADESLVIYATENADGWVQSDYWVSVGPE